MRQQAETWLREVLGARADFRDGQWEAIAALVERRERVLVVQRTGWGKSLVYFMATRLLRASGAGVTILISPLLSLMRNQIQAAADWGVRAATINSSNYSDHAAIEADLLANKIDLLLIAPERLANDGFQARVWGELQRRVGLLVIDEAHCISDWGHDFRPNYRRLMHILDEIPTRTPVLGTTATANDRVVADVSAILGAQMNIQRGALTRESLLLYVYAEAQEHAQRLTLIGHLLKSIAGSGIIYCTTTRDCRLVAEWLQQEGFNVQPYYSGVEEDLGLQREDLEARLLRNDLKALIASVALGMGFDKPDLHFVIHYQQPGNIISYYQQIGRAGRGIDRAHIILMHGQGDDDIQRHFIETAFPTPKQVEDTIAAFQRQGALTQTQLQQHVNARSSTIEKIMVHLEVERIVEKQGSAYHLIAPDARPDYARWRAVTQQREHELAQMQAYIQHDDCLMHFIAAALDDKQAPLRCGKCKNCRQQQSKFEPKPADVERARHFLRGGKPLYFEPRKQWVKGLPGVERVNTLRVNQTGLALCAYYESGRGELVRRARDTGAPYPDELIEAAAQLLLTHFATLPNPPAWATFVPSLRQPSQVQAFAEKLAQHLKLPLHPVIQPTQQHPPQNTMRNSHTQALNVMQSFIIMGTPPRTPVLLIDDFADSRWTLTVLGDLLQRQGCSTIHPFVLAVMQES